MARWRLESTRETREKIERLRENDEDSFELRNNHAVRDELIGVPEDTDIDILALKEDLDRETIISLGEYGNSIEGNLEGYGNGSIEEGQYGYDGQLFEDENTPNNNEPNDSQAEERARQEREEIERKEAEERVRQEAIERERIEAEQERMRQIAEQERLSREEEEKAKQRAEEERLRQEEEEKAKQRAEERIRQEAIERERMEAEQEKIRQREELEAFMEEIKQKAEQERLKMEERMRNPYKAIADDMLALSTLQNADSIKEIQEEICRNALIQLSEESKAAISNGNKYIDEKYNGDISKYINTFVDRNSEAFCERLSAKETWEKDDILAAIRTTVLDDEVMLWKTYGVAYIENNPVLREFSVKDMKYILLKYDFNIYKDFDDFKRQYTSFCEIVRQGCSSHLNHSDELRAFFEQTFENREDFYALLNNEEQLRKVYEKGSIGFLDILEKVDRKPDEHSTPEQSGPTTLEQAKIKEVLDSTKLERQPIFQDEVTEKDSEQESKTDTYHNDDLNESIKIQEKSIPSHMKADWQMRPVEDMEVEAGLRNKEDNSVTSNEKTWMNRFENWHKQSDKIPSTEKYSIMENIVQAMRDAKRLRNDLNRAQTENER